MAGGSVRESHAAFVALSRELRLKGPEFDFRYSLVDHLFTDALGWSRTEGEGHVNFEDDRKDVLCYDDSEPPFPVIVCETKRPSHDLDLDDVEQLETYMNGVGSAKYGILTNGHEFRLYEYVSEDDAIRAVEGLDVEALATTDFETLSATQQDALRALTHLDRDRYVDLGGPAYFRETYQEVPVQYQPGTDDEGYELFIAAVKDSLDELTDVLTTFFDDYRSREDGSYPKEFLESTFPDWEAWREYTGRSDNAKEVFCRETAYIILNRALFARIAEDKEIVSHTRLSFRGMAAELERDAARPSLDALVDTYDHIDEHYPNLYELGLFDWWWVSKDRRGQFSKTERRKQRNLEDDLDYALNKTLKRLNRFNFEYVNRDILGRVYEDYLPRQERKELGEYYTPIEVVQFMLDSVAYRPGEAIGRKKVLDPACGSGTFLTEVTERLIQHFLQKFGKTSVHELDADEARVVLERIEENVYGIDINPFAAHITQINLLFRTIDLYDRVTEKDPYYTMDGFEIHVADTLTPTVRERKAGSTDAETMQAGFEQFADYNGEQFADYNGRASAFIEDRNAVDRIKDEIAFDVVVANPPYVRIQNLRGMKDTYSSHYASAIKNFDIYVPFIERGIGWLTDDGKLTYICPNRLLNADYTERIRDRLVEEPITKLIDFKETDVFDVPTPYPCIISIDRERAVEGNEVHCARFAENSEGVLELFTHLDEWETPEPESERRVELFTYPQKRLKEDNSDRVLPIWKPMPESERRVFDKIESRADVRVRDVMDEVFQGLATSADNVYTGHVVEELNDGLVKFRPTGSEEAIVIEKDVLRKLLKGKEIERWKIDWQGLWLVFPYDEAGENATLLSQKTLQADLPKTWDFFKKYEDVLKDRESGRMRGRDDWYGYIYPKNLTKFDSAKIMLGVLRQEPSFVPDTKGEYYFVGGGTAGGSGVHVRAEYIDDKDDVLYFSAILNSKLLEFYHKNISFIFNSKYYSYGRNFLETHPLTKPRDPLREKIVQKTKAITDHYDELAELGYRVSDIRNYLPDYDRESTVLDLASSVTLDDDDYRQDPIRTNDPVGTDATYQVVLKQGHTLDFDDEQVRDFVFELLKAQDKRLGRREILDMNVPAKGEIHALMSEYETEKAKIDRLEANAANVQAELDDVLLREGYDLDEEDVAVVEEFLDVW